MFLQYLKKKQQQQKKTRAYHKVIQNDNLQLSDPGGYSWEFLVGACHLVVKNPDPISGQTNVIFHTYFQTRPLKPIPVFRPGLSNPFRIRIFHFQVSYSFGIETINTFIHSRRSLENHTRFQAKMFNVYKGLN